MSKPTLTGVVISNRKLREDLCHSFLFVLGWLSLPGLLLSLLRVFSVGWQPTMTLQLSVTVVLWALVLFRKFVPFSLKVGAIGFFWLVQSVYGLLYYGISGGGLGFLATLVIILAMLLGYKVGLASLVLSLGFMGVMTGLLASGQYRFSLDFQAYNTSTLAWLGAMVQLGFWSLAIFALTHRFQEILETAQNDTAHHASSLESLNRRLEIEVEKRRISEERMAAITDKIPEIISLIDENALLIYNSPSAERIHGWGLDELLNKSSLIYVHPEDQGTVQNLLKEMASHPGTSQTVIFRFRKKDGNYIWLEARISNELENPALRALLAVSRDVTERVESEREKEKLILSLEEANQEKERLLYGVSHDLKSPLITIRGFLGYVDKAVSEGKKDQAREDIKRITAALGWVEGLVEGLLNLSNLEQEEHIPMEFNMGAAVREALVPYRGELEKLGCQVTVAPDFPRVRSDYLRLVDLWKQLVDNAVKFRSEKRPLELYLGWQPIPGGVEYFIQDNGVGIEPAYRQKIFNMFEKLNAQTEGVGLGLTLVARTLETLGGRIRLESVPQEGSRFCFTIGSF